MALFEGAKLDALLSARPPPEVIGPSGQVYRSTSIFCLRPHQQPRRAAIYLVEWWCFDPLILLTIIANCVTLAWHSPLDPPSTLINACEMVFLVIFTAEMLSKILAYGFLAHEGAYLRNPWCQLDFVIVTLAWVPIVIPSFGNYSAFRSLRALRPLRTLKLISGMPMLIESVFRAMPRLFTVAALIGSVLLVFGIVGVELFKGQLHYYCADPEDAGARSDPFNFHLQASDLCDPTREGQQCATGLECLYHTATAASGTMNFDNIGGATIALMQAVTGDDYDIILHGLDNTFSPSASVYFVLVIIVCGFFIINLFLAVMFDEFIKAKATETAVQSAVDSAVAFTSPRTAAAGSRMTRGSAADDKEGARLLPAVSQLSDGSFTRAAADAGLRPQSWLAQMVTASWFNHGATALVLLNIFLMCMPYEGMSAAYETQLELCENVVSVLFMAEMALKLLGLGCQGYWSDGWNCLDGTIVLLTSFDMAVGLFASDVINLSFLRTLRMLRVLRVLRLMRSWRGLYRIVMTLVKSLPQLRNMFILMFLTLLIFSIMGMQLFGGRYGEQISYSRAPCDGGICPDSTLEPLPRFHFDHFIPAMITTFVLLTGKWSEAMEPAARAVGPVGILFFGSAVVVGMYFIMNLFIAILLGVFAEEFGQHDSLSDEDDDSHETKADVKRRASSHQRPHPPSSLYAEEDAWRDSYLCVPPESPLRRLCDSIVASVAFDRFIIVVIVLSSASLALDSPRLPSDSTLSIVLGWCDLISAAIFTLELLIKVIAKGFIGGATAYLKEGWNVLDFVIVTSSIIALLAAAMPRPTDGLGFLASLKVLRVLRPLRLVSRNKGMKLIVRSLFEALPDVSNVFGVVLTFQIVFAILGLQLFMGDLRTCTDPTFKTRTECNAAAAAAASAAAVADGAGGRNDAVVAWTNPADVPGSFDDFGSVMLLLYVMSTADDWDVIMYHTMDASADGHAPVRNDYSPASLFSILWMFVGSFFAMNLFVGVIVDNFNRIKKKLEQADEGGTATMTSDQESWAKTLISSLQSQELKKRHRASIAPEHPIRRAVYDFITSAPFEGAIFIVIVANILLMATDHYGIEEDEAFYAFYQSATETVVHIYYVECILKVIGMGKHYFTDRWCQLDFFLVCIALFDEFETGVISMVGASEGSTELLRVLRVLRILRILRLLKGAKQLKKLVLTILLCIAPLINITALLVLIVYIYSILGVQLFTYVVHQDKLNNDSNFDSVLQAALLLFQCLTGDGWSILMVEASIGPESGHCTDAKGDCGSRIAVPFFVSFQIIGAFVFLNLVVAVMIESFTVLGAEPDYSVDIVQVWHELTLTTRVAAYTAVLKAAAHPDAKLPDIELVARERLRDAFAWDVPGALAHLGLSPFLGAAPQLQGHPEDYGRDIFSIRMACLRDILLRLPPPIGLKGMVASRSDANKLCFQLRLTPVNGRIGLQELLEVLLRSRLTASALDQSTAPPTPSTSSTGVLSSPLQLPPLAKEPLGLWSGDSATSMALDTLKEHIHERKNAEAINRRMQSRRLNQVMKRAKSRKPQQHTLGVPEHAWQSVTSGVFFPIGPLKQRWDALMMFLILYTVVVVPYRVGFDDPAVGRWWVFEVFVTLAFLSDLVATFNTAFLDGERWNVMRSQIAGRYLHGWFWVDLPASVPVELIMLFIPEGSGTDTSKLKMLRGLRLVRLVRLLKLLKLDEYIPTL